MGWPNRSLHPSKSDGKCKMVILGFFERFAHTWIGVKKPFKFLRVFFPEVGNLMAYRVDCQTEGRRYLFGYSAAPMLISCLKKNSAQALSIDDYGSHYSSPRLQFKKYCIIY